MSERKYVIEQMISAKSIAARVEGLAAEITARLRRTPRSWSSSACCAARSSSSPIWCARSTCRSRSISSRRPSYGDAMHSSREVRILKDLRGEIAGRDVLVVEDIVDTGFTLHHVVNLLLSREPRRLEVCALLDKPSRREVDIRATWTGFEIPDEFVVGYGIDYAQRNRNLPYIGS
jgi:hypoxanthine phosphoribosyltransferase